MENISPLFAGLSADELARLRSSACMRAAEYDKGGVIFAAGDVIRETGIVESGSVNIESIDLWGGRSILSNVGRGGVFGETYALCGEPLLVDAAAAERCRVLFLRYGTLMRENAELCGRLTANMLEISLRKNMELSGRMLFTAPKTVRRRLLAYLSAMSVKSGSAAFRVPFDRRGLADYLNVDRSALSKELGKMRREGLIEFSRSEFRIVGGTMRNS